MLRRIETTGMKLGGSRLERIDLARREAVAARLVPIGAVDRMVGEADRVAIVAPVRARGDELAIHWEPRWIAFTIRTRARDRSPRIRRARRYDRRCPCGP